MKVSDYIIKFLEDKNVKHVFTVSGGGSIHLIDSLRKSKKIDTICFHHEQSAAMAADGYFRINDNIACVLLTTGPGGINALNGVFGCWVDSVPCFVISGQVATSQLSENSGCRQIGDQEYNIIETAKSMTKYAVLVKDKKAINKILERAYYEAFNNRPGPVWIDVPLDIQSSQIEEEELSSFNIPLTKPVSMLDVSDLLLRLKQSKKPLIVVGNGVKVSGSGTYLNTFLERNGIPAMTSVHSAIDAVDNQYKYYVGRHGVLGHLSSNTILQECDLLINIGARLTNKTTGYDVSKFAPKAFKVIIDVDEAEINKHKFKIDKKILCDCRELLFLLHTYVNPPEIKEWQEFCLNIRSKEITVYPKHKNLLNFASSYVLMDRLSSILDKNVPIITSNGAAHVIAHKVMRLKTAQKMFTNVGCASMGYGLPAAIGACFANQLKTVLCLEGDGSVMMNLQEFQTIRHYNLPVKTIIINNGGYVSIKQTQDAFFKGEQFCVDRTNGVSFPDFEKVSAAFDIPFFRIRDNNEIDSVLYDLFNVAGPAICEIITHPKEYFEPKVIHKGVDEKGNIIPGELTNMYISESYD